MTIVVTGHSTSLEGFIAGADDSSVRPLGVGGDRLSDWFSNGDTPSRFYSEFKMSSASAAFFDEYAGRVGAIITGAEPTTSPTRGAGADRYPVCPVRPDAPRT